MARPTVLNDEVRTKIEQAAALDASLEEIAFYAGVHRNTLRRWMDDDEGLRCRIEELRQKPMLKARQTIITALEDPNHAFRYAEKKRPQEFANATKIEHSGTVQTEVASTPEGVRAAVLAFEEAMRAQLIKPYEVVPERKAELQQEGSPDGGKRPDEPERIHDEVAG